MATWIKRPQNYNQLLLDFLVILTDVGNNLQLPSILLKIYETSCYGKKGKVYFSEDVTRPARISYSEVQTVSKRISC